MRNKQEQGFTLIELIVGIVVIVIVTLVVTTGMGQLFRQSVEPWQQVRATEIGQSLMNEIMARRFDHNSNVGNQYLRCSEPNAEACTTIVSCPLTSNESYSEQGEQRRNFNDVDDYNGLVLNGAELSGDSSNRYKGFEASIFVCEQKQNRLKRITVNVTTPQNDAIEFSAIKGNW